MANRIVKQPRKRMEVLIQRQKVVEKIQQKVDLDNNHQLISSNTSVNVSGEKSNTRVEINIMQKKDNVIKDVITIENGQNEYKVRIGKFLYDKRHYSEEELDKIRRGELISGDLLYRNRHIKHGQKILSYHKPEQNVDQTRVNNRIAETQPIDPVLDMNHNIIDESSSYVDFASVEDSSNSNDEIASLSSKTENIYQFILTSLMCNENALAFLKHNSDSYKKIISERLIFSGYFRVIHYFCGIGNIDEYCLIDLIYFSVLFNIEIVFDVFTFLNRTFKHIKIENTNAKVVFTRSVTPLPREKFLNCLEIDRVNLYLDELLVRLVREEIWIVCMSLDRSHPFEFDSVEIRSLPRGTNSNEKDCDVTGCSNLNADSLSFNKRRINYITTKDSIIEEDLTNSHVGFDIDAFCGTVYPENIRMLKFTDEIFIKSTKITKNTKRSNLTIAYGLEFRKLHNFYHFDIGLIDSGIGPIHISIVTDIEHIPRYKPRAERFVKSLNKKINKYASLTARDPISMSVSNSRVDKNFFMINKLTRGKRQIEKDVLKTAFCINGSDFNGFMKFIRSSPTVRTRFGFLYFTLYGSKKKTYFTNSIQPFIKLDCVGNLAAFDTLNIDFNFSLIPKDLEKVVSFNSKSRFFSATEGAYDLFFSKELSCLNQNQIKIIPYTKFRVHNENNDNENYPPTDRISLHQLSVDKVNFYSPLYRSIIPDHIMHLKGAQITSGILIDILSKIGGENNVENESKKHVLSASIDRILKNLDANTESTYPFRNEINGGIHSVSVSSSFLLKDTIRNGRFFYVETEKLTGLSSNFLKDFLKCINWKPEDLNPKRLVEIILAEIIIFTNFFKGSLNMHTACLPNLRKIIKTLFCKEKIPQYDLESIVNEITNSLTDIELRAIIERYIHFQYGARRTGEKTLLDLFTEIILNRNTETFYNQFLEKYMQIFFPKFKEKDFSQQIEGKFLFQEEMQDYEFDVFISIDSFVSKIKNLATLDIIARKYPIFWSLKILQQTALFSESGMIAYIGKFFKEYGIKNLMLIDQQGKGLKCQIIEGQGIYTETSQFVQKITLMNKIVGLTPQSTRTVFTDYDWARLQAGLTIYSSKPSELLSDFRYGFLGLLDIKKLYSKIQALKRMGKERKDRIDNLTAKYDISSISFEQILNIMVRTNKTALDIDSIRKLILYSYRLKLLSELQLKGNIQIEEFLPFLSRSRETNEEWTRVRRIIDDEVECFFSNPSAFYTSIGEGLPSNQLRAVQDSEHVGSSNVGTGGIANEILHRQNIHAEIINDYDDDDRADLFNNDEHLNIIIAIPSHVQDDINPSENLITKTTRKNTNDDIENISEFENNNQFIGENDRTREEDTNIADDSIDIRNINTSLLKKSEAPRVNFSHVESVQYFIKNSITRRLYGEPISIPTPLIKEERAPSKHKGVLENELNLSIVEFAQKNEFNLNEDISCSFSQVTNPTSEVKKAYCVENPYSETAEWNGSILVDRAERLIEGPLNPNIRPTQTESDKDSVVLQNMPKFPPGQFVHTYSFPSLPNYSSSEPKEKHGYNNINPGTKMESAKDNDDIHESCFSEKGIPPTDSCVASSVKTSSLVLVEKQPVKDNETCYWMYNYENNRHYLLKRTSQNWYNNGASGLVLNTIVLRFHPLQFPKVRYFYIRAILSLGNKEPDPANQTVNQISEIKPDGETALITHDNLSLEKKHPYHHKIKSQRIFSLASTMEHQNQIKLLPKQPKKCNNEMNLETTLDEAGDQETSAIVKMSNNDILKKTGSKNHPKKTRVNENSLINKIDIDKSQRRGQSQVSSKRVKTELKSQNNEKTRSNKRIRTERIMNGKNNNTQKNSLNPRTKRLMENDGENIISDKSSRGIYSQKETKDKQKKGAHGNLVCNKIQNKTKERRKAPLKEKTNFNYQERAGYASQKNIIIQKIPENREKRKNYAYSNPEKRQSLDKAQNRLTKNQMEEVIGINLLKKHKKNEKIGRKKPNNKILRNEIKTIQEKSINGCKSLRTSPTKKVKKSNAKIAEKRADPECITEKNALAKKLRKSEEINGHEIIKPTRKRCIKKPASSEIDGKKHFIIREKSPRKRSGLTRPTIKDEKRTQEEFILVKKTMESKLKKKPPTKNTSLNGLWKKIPFQIFPFDKIIVQKIIGKIITNFLQTGEVRISFAMVRKRFFNAKARPKPEVWAMFIEACLEIDLIRMVPRGKLREFHLNIEYLKGLKR